jgi:hypothetical protein
MIVNFDCEFCGRGQTSAASNAGKTVVCRYCGGDCVVPRGAPAGPPAGASPGQAIGTPVGGGPEKTTYHPPPQGDPFRPPQTQRAPQPGHNPYQAPNANLGARNYQPPNAVPPEVNSAATAAIVCGALGWGLCLVFAPFAIWQAGKAADLARRAGVPVPQTATIGKYLALAQLVIFCGFFMLAIVAGALGG